MTTANLTEDGKQLSYEELYCSAIIVVGIHSQLIFLSVLNVILSITAFFGNTLILVALHKETSLHPPTKIMYRNLATTDLCVGIIAEPLAVAVWVSQVNERWNICRYAFVVVNVTAYILCTVSMFTVTAISIDRLLALLLGLRYRQVLTSKRIYVTFIGLWVVSIVGTSLSFSNFSITLWCTYIETSVCLVTSIFCYAKIFLTLRHHHIQVQDPVLQEQPRQAIPMNRERYRKAMHSALWVQLTLVACYVPHGIVSALLAQRELSSPLFLAYSLTTTLVFLNSSLNPILYCWKIREVKQAVKDTIRQFGCPPI